MAELVHGFKKNQAMQLASWLAIEHGFEPGLGVEAMMRVLDEQHAIRVSLASMAIAPAQAKDVAADWELSFGFARRDINEHLALWLDKPQQNNWFGQTTISELRRVFVTEERLKFGGDVSFESVLSQVGSAVEAALEMANLKGIEEQLYLPLRGQIPITSCAVNDALNGVDRIWDEYLANHDKVMSGANEDVRKRRQHFDSCLREFRAANPNGVPR